jgi:hypothetical protein
MAAPRAAAAGATRSCPHCKSTILQSASQCPACGRFLRFDASEAAVPSETALRVEGTIRQPLDAPIVEYTVLLTIRNERGEEVARQLVGVGALHPDEARSFSLAVEVSEPPAGSGNRRSN